MTSKNRGSPITSRATTMAPITSEHDRSTDAPGKMLIPFDHGAKSVTTDVDGGTTTSG